MARPVEPVPQDIVDRVLEGLYSGKPLSDICDEEGMPNVRSISRWCAKDETFASDFARARKEGAAARFDKAGRIVAKATPETVQVAKLQAEHEYKAAACFCPSVFGQRATMALGGDRDGAPIKISHVDAEKELASILAAAASRQGDDGEGSD